VDKDLFALVRGPVDPRCVEGLPGAGHGGAVTFLGIVRNRSDDDKLVDGLSYEAFETMALAEFAAIANEARERFGDVRLGIVHAVGDLDVGAIAVAVAAVAAHRAAAFDACRYAIDELKRRAPIWKKERYAGGEALWKSNE
jgi:molybdopterin synthase catalytic subunit